MSLVCGPVIRPKAPVLIVVELKQVAEREIDHLSGGELQRFALGLVCVQQADV